MISRFILNLRRSATRSGYTREDSEIETSQTITNVVFRGVVDALDELGRELDDGEPYLLTPHRSSTTDRASGLSNFILFDRAVSTRGDRSSWTTQSDLSSVDGHGMGADSASSAIKIELYVDLTSPQYSIHSPHRTLEALRASATQPRIL